MKLYVVCFVALVIQFHLSENRKTNFQIENVLCNNENTDRSRIIKCLYGKIARTKKALTLYFENFMDLDKKDLSAHLKTEIFLSNEYRSFPVTIWIDPCKAEKTNMYGIQSLLKYGNFSFCDYRKGIYGVTNWPVDLDFPENIPSGRFKIILTCKHRQEKLFTLQVLCEVLE